jgi:hypothetical protein
VQRHIIDDADVGKGQEDFRGTARQLAVAKNVAMDAAAGEQTIGIDDTVDIVDDVDINTEIEDGKRMNAQVEKNRGEQVQKSEQFVSDTTPVAAVTSVLGPPGKIAEEM